MPDIPGDGSDERRPRHWKRKLEAIKETLRQEYESQRGAVGREPAVPPSSFLPAAGAEPGKDVAAQLIESLSFLGKHLFSWTAVLLAVPCLWAFGTLMLQVPTPTLVDFAIGESLFVAANAVLFLKIVVATYKSYLGSFGLLIVTLAARGKSFVNE